MSTNSQLKMASALIVKKGDAAPSGCIVPPSYASRLKAEAGALDPNGPNKVPPVVLTADFVRRGREFPMSPTASSTAMPNTSGEDGAGQREWDGTERRSGTTEKRFRKLFCAASSMNPVALYSVIFVIGFISFAFAMDISGELIDMIAGTHSQS